MISKLDDFNIKAFNTFGINVKCDTWIEYTESADLPIIFANIEGAKYRCIGQGSNLLFVNDYHGSLLHSRILDVECTDTSAGVLMRIGAGVSLDSIIERACSAGLWGLENLSGIPGDAGAAAVQNVGAYGVEIKDVIVSVDCYDIVLNKFVTLQAEQCNYGYRDSLFKHPDFKNRYVVTYVTLALESKGIPKLDYGNLRAEIADTQDISPMLVRTKVMEIRNDKLPAPTKIGSAGSFFKNPVFDKALFEKIRKQNSDCSIPHFPVGGNVKIPAAWLIEKCGWKGKVSGNVAVWSKQPLVIVNHTGYATGLEIETVERQIVADVEQKFGITLYPEVDHIY